MSLIAEGKDTLAGKKAHSLAVKNILFATDFSAASEAALPYAAAICRRFGSTLHLVHVMSEASVLMAAGGVDYMSMGTIYEDARAEAKQRIRQLAERFAGIECFKFVLQGQVWKSLARLIEETEIELIILGTHGRTGFGKLLLGSVAEDILRHSPCPVLTVGPKVAGRAKLPELDRSASLAPVELELRQIVFATNLGLDATRVAPYAVQLAEEFQARLTLLHVSEDAKASGQAAAGEDELRRLRGLIPEHATLQYAPQALVEFGAVAGTILRVAEERDADMLVLGARAAEDAVGSTHLPWHTAHQVIAQAHCPVLTIRA